MQRSALVRVRAGLPAAQRACRHGSPETPARCDLGAEKQRKRPHPFCFSTPTTPLHGAVAPAEFVKQLTSIAVEPGVDIEVSGRLVWAFGLSCLV